MYISYELYQVLCSKFIEPETPVTEEKFKEEMKIQLLKHSVSESEFLYVLYCIGRTKASNIRELRMQLGLTRKEMCRRFKLQIRTLENWEYGKNNPPEYFFSVICYVAFTELLNGREAERALI